MHALACHSLRTATRYSTFRACRIIAGKRFPQPSRAFRTSSLLRTYNDSANTNETGLATNAEAPELSSLDENSQRLEDPIGDTKIDVAKDNVVADELPAEEIAAAAAERPTRLKEGRDSTSGGRRTRSSPRLKRPPPLFFKVPSWFLERNIKLREELKILDPRVELVPNPAGSENLGSTAVPEGNIENQSSSESPNEGFSKSATPESGNSFSAMYQIDASVMQEIEIMASSSLHKTSSSQENGFASSKPHLLLQCPKDGGALFLEAVVENIAQKLEADLITVDAQDIAELAREQESLFPVAPANSFSSFGYETHLQGQEQESPELEDLDAEEEGYDDFEDANAYARPKSNLFPPSRGGGSLRVVQIPVELVKAPKSLGPSSSPFGNSMSLTSTVQSSTGSTEAVDPDMVVEFVTLLMDSNNIKRHNSRSSKEEPLKEPLNSQPVPPRIILIKDYLEMNAVAGGSAVLSKLHQAVKAKRSKGQQVLIIGTTSSEDFIPSMSKSGFRNIQAESVPGPYRTIITPCANLDIENTFLTDIKLRTKQINLRHIRDMFRQLAHESLHAKISSTVDGLDFSSADTFIWDLDQHVWSMDRVHRVVTTALGFLKDGEILSSAHLISSLKLLESSDKSKFDWLDQEKDRIPDEPSDGTKKALDEKMKKLRKTCNSYEKKLLNGVVDPSSLHTKFEDVRLPASSIEAVKTLTSLSLVRPEAFTYGVLATDKISGLLLYGPPGTGKTLLAKAVAKESQATVLEVSGSDIYDMYVGEGEKNVRAIFTLAKKLSPCVVFIDEADAIFGSRNTSSNRTSHRELINQFLREWDGLNDLSAFIMVATNRPFDLDDAVLRRLPRRLLVDLPTEKDRESILKIHLKDESLHSSVSLSSLASKTPFYSGSDLKNLSVAAALACVREENEVAAKHTGSEPHKYPERRTLTGKHFESALAEISASISEDMSSLVAIRKFDEKYGDKRGRKKRNAAWGFGTISEKERERADEGRVRAQEVEGGS